MGEFRIFYIVRQEKNRNIFTNRTNIFFYILVLKHTSHSKTNNFFALHSEYEINLRIIKKKERRFTT